MPLASAVVPEWSSSQPIDYGQSYVTPPPSVEQPPPPAPMGAPPPAVGVDYAPPPGAPGSAPSGPPPMRGISADEAIRLARTGMAPARPAGFQPTTRSESVEGRQASPELEQATKDKLEADADATAAQFKYDQALGGAQSEANKRLALQDQIQARDQAARMADQQQRLAVDRDHITQLMAKANEPQQSAEKEYWGGKSALSTIATGISMFLKGFVFSGYGRGQDPGQWLNQQIQQVVQEQQARAARNREAVGNAKDLYAMNKEALGDDDRAKLATEMALRQNLVAQLDRRVAEAAADPMGQLRLATLKKTLADQNAATLEQFWDKTAEKHTSSQSDKYLPAGSGGKSPLQILRDAKEIKGLSSDLANDVPEQKTALDLQKEAAETKKLEASAGPGGGKGAGRALLRGMAEAHANIDALEELQRIARQTVIGPKDQARAEVILDSLEGRKVKLPGVRGSTMWDRALGSTQAALEQERANQVSRYNRANELIRNGGTGGEDLDQPIEGTEAGVAPGD